MSYSENMISSSTVTANTVKKTLLHILFFSFIFSSCLALLLLSLLFFEVANPCTEQAKHNSRPVKIITYGGVAVVIFRWDFDKWTLQAYSEEQSLAQQEEEAEV